MATIEMPLALFLVVLAAVIWVSVAESKYGTLKNQNEELLERLNDHERSPPQIIAEEFKWEWGTTVEHSSGKNHVVYGRFYDLDGGTYVYYMGEPDNKSDGFIITAKSAHLLFDKETNDTEDTEENNE